MVESRSGRVQRLEKTFHVLVTFTFQCTKNPVKVTRSHHEGPSEVYSSFQFDGPYFTFITLRNLYSRQSRRGQCERAGYPLQFLY